MGVGRESRESESCVFTGTHPDFASCMHATSERARALDVFAGRIILDGMTAYDWSHHALASSHSGLVDCAITQPLRSSGLSEDLGVVKGELENKRRYNDSDNGECPVKRVKVAQRSEGPDMSTMMWLSPMPEEQDISSMIQLSPMPDEQDISRMVWLSSSVDIRLLQLHLASLLDYKLPGRRRRYAPRIQEFSCKRSSIDLRVQRLATVGVLFLDLAMRRREFPSNCTLLRPCR